jgi:phosphonopyruvate decarboxylase
MREILKKIDSQSFLKILLKNNINFFSGVPDSCTSGLVDEIISNDRCEHILCPNEGNAISVGIGYNISTSKVPCIYFQNSGLGNATDPITNLCTNYIYNIPLLLLIGWRGRPGIIDEPQHKMQGMSLKSILRKFKIKYIDVRDLNESKLNKILNKVKKENQRFAILIDKKYFIKKNIKISRAEKYFLRKEVFSIIFKNISKNTKLITSTGYNSREAIKHDSDKIKKLYLVGAMGHTFSIAYSLSLYEKNKVICIDGDGSFFMHLGSFVIIKKNKKKNFIYILLDNNRHESVGNVEINYNLSIKNFAKNVGFDNYIFIDNKNKKKLFIKYLKNYKGITFIHIKTRVGVDIDLPRPKNLNMVKKIFIGNF